MLTEQQKINRKKGLGGSDIAGILGISKYQTPLKIYLSKVDNDIINEEENKIFDRGNTLEPFVRCLFNQRINNQSDKKFNVEIIEDTLIHNDYSFLIANLDGIITGEDSKKAILEIKTINSIRKNEFGDEMTDELPTDILLQTQHYLSVVSSNPNLKSIDTAYVAVLMEDERKFDELTRCVKAIGLQKTLEIFGATSNLKIYKVKKNVKLHNVIIEQAKKFWFDHVLKKNPPAYKNIEEILLSFPNSVPDKTIVASPKTQHLIEEFKAQQETIKKLEEELAEKKTIIASEIQDAEVVLNDNGNKIASWKTTFTKIFDSKKFSEEHPEFVDKYQKISPRRSFRAF